MTESPKTPHEKALEKAWDAFDHEDDPRVALAQSIAAYTQSLAEQGWYCVSTGYNERMYKAADAQCRRCIDAEIDCPHEECSALRYSAALTAAPTPGDAP